ncbi:Rossmann fold nucleotide-binding protein [Nocardioides sp. TRM66260-LWL]|uniref:LOG family protein n=1 Tax=Nocardioides sp. TRM66260-LWL TaxID=2874478 RepID=UPI001CC57677|nr:Rossmann fold nucleotide-binding protein [Nocardioides sp. TRM66260-LWL]MBZ5733188.1 Rossmann fold nucleotide-binding protein [Nocardioides sp. TRM66260-LWL]
MTRTRGRVRHLEPTVGLARADAAARLDGALAAAPLDVVRTRLYTAAELYDAPAYADTLDARAYAWARQPRTPAAALAGALHDHAIDQALEGWVAERRRGPSGGGIVGVMGGHAVDRDAPAYRDAARLGLRLAARHVVATGGGPGAMEAASLGARLAGLDDAATALDEALALLAPVPSFRPSIDAWLTTAQEVCARWPSSRDGLGIPTWHYGHEPPSLFPSAIAKYLRNALREAILLEVCDAGIVFLPGAAGTVQEVFQDACENYYAAEAEVAPMVLVGVRHWTEELPVWPLLRRLAQGRAMAERLHLVDDVDEAAAVLAG